MLFLGFFNTLLLDDLTVFAVSILDVYEYKNYLAELDIKKVKAGWQDAVSHMTLPRYNASFCRGDW